ncbi:MAG: FMN-binding protein, partial [Clostridia bacterium]|nr:FMN-binding protein [Clostridia bacterium]
ATTLFEAEGKIVDIYIDQLEVATPNYDGATMPHLTGVPGQSYNLDSDHDAKVDGTQTATEESFAAELKSWQTKRQRGSGYVMGTGTWDVQMDTFQKLFVGKTVEEVEAWFAKYCSDRNGRPLQAGSSNEQDAAKYDPLTDDEKAMLADVTTSATMSLNDSHGNILAAIRDSLEKKVDVNLTIGK